MEAMVIDCRFENTPVFFASVTRLPEEHNEVLVLRFAAEGGKMADYVGQKIDLPVIVMGKWKERQLGSFYEFVKTVGWGFPVLIAGGTGMDGRIFDDDLHGQRSAYQGGLQVLGRPIAGHRLPAGCTIRTVATHRNLNYATADAARDGLRLRATALKTIAIVHGQDNCVGGYLLLKSKEGQEEEAAACKVPLFETRKSPVPEEHRLDIFSPEKLVEKAYWRRTRKFSDDPAERIGLVYFFLCISQARELVHNYEKSMPLVGDLHEECKTAHCQWGAGKEAVREKLKAAGCGFSFDEAGKIVVQTPAKTWCLERSVAHAPDVEYGLWALADWTSAEAKRAMYNRRQAAWKAACPYFREE